MKAMASSISLLVIATLLLLPCARAEFPKIEHSLKSGGSLSLLVIGDYGRQGEYNQSQVAAQMGKYGEELNIDFVISAGDNFYENGLAGVDDKLFDESFTDIYTANSLQRPWYSVLGNHDYRGNVLAQLSPVLREIDNRWICMRSFVLDTEIAHFFFVDTTPLVMKYWRDPKHSYDWRGVLPRENYVSNLLKDFETALRESTATWKFVIAHHPIRSVSDHGDTQELIEMFLPLLKAYGVDLYINGHDHCLEHISSIDST